MKYSRILCLSIASLLLCSCADTADTPVVDTVADSAKPETEAVTEPSYLDSLGEKDFGGAVFSVIGTDYAARRNFPDPETA